MKQVNVSGRIARRGSGQIMEYGRKSMYCGMLKVSLNSRVEVSVRGSTGVVSTGLETSRLQRAGAAPG